MELVPVEETTAAGATDFSVSPAGAALMNIRTVPVRRRYVTNEVRMVGKVDYDETKLAYITAWVPGRLDRLYVDSTGVPVQQGEHLAEIYSPDLLAAQEEYIQARRAVEGLPANGGGIVAESTRATLEAVREKLRLLGISQDQIQAIADRGSPRDHMTITAPVSGIVVDKHAREGMYVQTGMRIYTLADLTEVWVQLDAYESDLAWLKYGQRVELTTIAYPGETFEGTISLIHPVLDSTTRTVRVRVNVPNLDGRLKPGMLVNAFAHSRLAKGGRVMDPDLAGKYICTMHPEVITDEPGQCPECGMDLVRTELLGYVSADEAVAAAPLVIPASAALLTGKRAVVYVKDPQADEPTFTGRQIVLGPRAGDWYIVERGLAAGEEVVVRGNFKIDSALQIQARPSMMSPEGMPLVEHAESHDMPVAADVPHAFRTQFGDVIDAYMPLQQALAGDDLNAASTAAATMADAIAAVQPDALPGELRTAWTERTKLMAEALEAVAEADEISAARARFSEVSELLAGVVRKLGVERVLYLMKCPMAFNNAGARWLQFSDEVSNPYFGASMLRCGSVVETFGQAPADGEDHVHE
jgi:Cu(I)/Ag(I) efflux system membrane fusion protein